MSNFIQEVEKIVWVSLNKRPKKDYITVHIVWDVNDGDYIEAATDINLEDFKRLVKISKNVMSYKGRHNYENINDILDLEEDLDLLSNFLPCLDNEELHTIVSIKFTIYTEEGIYDINF